MSRSPVVEKRSSAPVAGQLIRLLERVATAFRELEGGGTDEVSLLADLEALRSQLGETSRDLQDQEKLTQSLCEKVRLEASRDEFFKAIDGDERLLQTTRRDLHGCARRLDETEGSAEVLYKITASRSLLRHVKDVKTARGINQALTTCSITHEKIQHFVKTLRHNLSTLKGKGLHKLVRYDEYDPEEEPLRDAEPSAPAASTAKKTPVPPPAPAQASPATASAPKADASKEVARIASGDHLKEIVDALNNWSRTYPLVASNLGSNMRIVDARRSPVVKVRIRALWGERKRFRRTEPYRGAPVEDGEVSSLWHLPASPPQGMEDAKEKVRRLPGDEKVIDCGTCSRSGRIKCGECDGKRVRPCRNCSPRTRSGGCRSCTNGQEPCRCDEGKVSCPDCDGSGQRLQYYICETRYSVRRLKEAARVDGLPRGLLLDEDDKRMYQKAFAAFHSDVVEPDLEDECLAAMREWVVRSNLHDVVEAFYKSPLTEQKGGVESSLRLVRSKVEVSHVRLLQLSCELSQAKTNKASRFRVWFYGNARKLYTGEIPRRWTWKATAWLTALGAASVLAGYLVSLLA